MDAHDPTNGAAVNAGERLKAAREQAGWSIEHVALKLRLSTAQVAALEKGEREGLPPAAYVRGYLRSYAQLLGLDPQEFAKAHLGVEVAREQTPKAVAPPKKTVSWEPFAYIVFVISVVVVVVWWRMDKRAPTRVSQSTVSPVEAIGALPPRLRSLAVPGASDGQLSEFPLQSGPLVSHPSVVTPSPNRPGPRKSVRTASAGTARVLRVPAPGKLAARRKASAPGPTTLSKATPQGVRVPRLKAATRAAGLPAAPPSAVPNPGGLISLPQGRRYATLAITATARGVRVSVRDANGTRLLATRVKAGREVHVVGRPPFRVTLSRTRGVLMMIGGHAVALPSAQKGHRLRVTVDR